MFKSISREKIVFFPLEISVFVRARNTIVLEHVIIQLSLYNLLSGRLQEVKNKGKFSTFSSVSGHGCLQVVVSYKEVPNIVI